MKVLNFPSAKMPLHAVFRQISKQIDTTIQVTEHQTFLYNVPTHYLVWVAALSANKIYTMDELPFLLRDYPMPKDLRGALRGAKNLGLLHISGQDVSLTETGKTAQNIIPVDLSRWTQIHLIVKQRNAPTLAEYEPVAAEFLKLLLLKSPIVNMLIEALNSLPEKAVTFDKLAQTCDTLDHIRTVVFFFNPETVPLFSTEDGEIIWSKVDPAYYRSTTYLQYKSILKHAGILIATALGGSTSKNYMPEKDIWTLRISD
ncbi:hypothetical protein [Candidatus Venteria ishoeyi]|uniref:Uncharacterized protein n=2 Tax=Candidatus Venteria ishoeyi TaxID=1899563 RepID=A0A1H6F273_9GAMM|nr:hypothetical protein [Candidatus Venteria ishoeyi]SEH04247.1 Uncharacterised protein [Candidatus Venteria ishoeyi]